MLNICDTEVKFDFESGDDDDEPNWGVHPVDDEPIIARGPRDWDPQPDDETLVDWMNDGGCQATDGCWTEVDGSCPHGHNSWLIVLGLI